MAYQPLMGQDLLITEISWSHSDTPHSVDSSGRAISLTQIPLADNTQHSHETEIHGPGGDSNPQPQKESGRRHTP